MSKTEEKLDKILDKVTDLEVISAKQEVNMREHMRRTALLETQIIPLQKHDNMMIGARKLLIIVGAVVGIAATIYRSLN
jgi:hypothetical protein